MTPLIDMHSHVCPRNLASSPSPANSAWPHMCASGAGAALFLGDRPFRQLDTRSWNISRRLDDMARDGVTMQVLSPMPELLSHWFTPDEAEILCDDLNATISSMAAAAPKQFAGLGMVPMQDVQAAIRYLPRLRATFGLAGLEIGTHINGVMLGDAALLPFWAAAAEQNLAVFIHPLHPLTTRLAGVPPLFHPLAGFPADSALAGASLLMAGVLARHPTLRIGLSHGGGALAPVIPRLDQAYASMPAFRATLTEQPSATARKFFYDSNVYDAAYLTHLITRIAPDQVFLGTDYPYEIMQTNPREFLAQLNLPAPACSSLFHGAAQRFLHIPAGDSK